MAKVLIVDDDTLISRMYERIFRFEGHDVMVAADGQEGLDKAREVNPTIILLDIMMPKLNGLEVLEKLKADPMTKNIPVVLLTNLSGDLDAETAISKGAIKYIIKSEHDPKQVADMVTQIISTTPVPSATSISTEPADHPVPPPSPTNPS